MIRKLIDNLLEKADRVVDDSDDTGCSDDLTVTTKSSVEELRKAVAAIRHIYESTAEDIARLSLRVGTLKTRGSDSLDFHECSVTGIKEALIDALKTHL